MNLLVQRGASHARCNWGRWIADCSSPHCKSAMQLRRGWPAFTCYDCGQLVEVVWPDDELADGVERLLMMRPDPNTRNWETGETLNDLLNENMLHGVLPKGIEEHPGGVVLEVTDDRIVQDPLRLLAPVHHEIGA